MGWEMDKYLKPNGTNQCHWVRLLAITGLVVERQKEKGEKDKNELKQIPLSKAPK